MASATLDYNKSFINEEIIEWIDGLLLGDGGINFSKDTFKGGRIYIGSSSKEWSAFGLSKLSSYSPSEPKPYHKITYRCPNQIWTSKTLTHPDIVSQAKRWYAGENLKKAVPTDVRITPTSVMLWYLGDGSLTHIEECNTYVVRLSTCAFSPNEIENILIPKLAEHNIEGYRDQHKNDIRIAASSIGRFFDFIGNKSPISCYDYKFNIPEWLRLIRLSDIVENDKQKWTAQYWYKSGQLECTKSPGGKMLLFTKDQAEILKQRLNISSTEGISQTI